MPENLPVIVLVTRVRTAAQELEIALGRAGESAILQCFLQAPGRSLSRQEMHEVWGEGYALEERALDVHIQALRHNIRDDPGRRKVIVTVPKNRVQTEALVLWFPRNFAHTFPA